MESSWKENGNNWRIFEEVEGSGWNGSNARSRGKCQADGTDDVRYMVFVLKIGKYGSENDFLIEN